MKIRLIEPEPPGMNVYSKVMLPRLGLPIIGAALTARGHDVKIYVSQMAPIDWNDVFSADLVGISTTTSTAIEGYDFADSVRAKGVPVIIGGSHVTFMADEALEHADYVARGEGGEEIMLELIEALHGEREFDTIRGLSFRRNDGEVVHGDKRDFCADLDSLPFPDLDLIVGHEQLTTTPIMTSWGCPFNCNFCSVTAMFGKKYRFRSPENVIAEIRAKNPAKIFFYDDNMAADKRRLKVLLQMMIDQDLVVPWSTQVRIDVTRDLELLDLMRRSGCQIVYLGLESVSQDTLDGFNKAQSVDDIVTGIKLLHEYGINSHGMFVLGADTDTRQTIRDTVKFARKNHIDTVMLNILTPLPGTVQYFELEAADRIFEHRWHLYDAHHVVYTPKLMSPYELQFEVIRAYAHFYSLGSWLKYFFALRFTKLLYQGWGWHIVRRWRKDERNKAFMEALKQLHWPRPKGGKTAPTGAPSK
jgi:anaerobic magnesium-protoporphyrin IX monomethyl ester cyclase